MIKFHGKLTCESFDNHASYFSVFSYMKMFFMYFSCIFSCMKMFFTYIFPFCLFFHICFFNNIPTENKLVIIWRLCFFGRLFYFSKIEEFFTGCSYLNFLIFTCDNLYIRKKKLVAMENAKMVANVCILVDLINLIAIVQVVMLETIVCDLVEIHKICIVDTYSPYRSLKTLKFH